MNLVQSIRAIEQLKADILFPADPDNDPAIGLPPQSEQAFLKSVAFLELARAEMQMADYLHMRNQ